TIFALGHDINVADILQKKCQFVTGQLLIVNDYSRKRHLDLLPETCTSISIEVFEDFDRFNGVCDPGLITHSAAPGPFPGRRSRTRWRVRALLYAATFRVTA